MIPVEQAGLSLAGHAPYQNNYLFGRYGAIPFIGKWKFWSTILNGQLIVDAIDEQWTIFLSKLDMKYHNSSKAINDPTDEAVKLVETIMEYHPNEYDQHFSLAVWYSIMGDKYDAGYYGYLWSRAMAEAVFAKIKLGGLTDSQWTTKLRELYEQSKQQKPEDLVQPFLGHKYRKEDMTTFFNKLGRLTLN